MFLAFAFDMCTWSLACCIRHSHHQVVQRLLLPVFCYEQLPKPDYSPFYNSVSLWSSHSPCRRVQVLWFFSCVNSHKNIHRVVYWTTGILQWLSMTSWKARLVQKCKFPMYHSLHVVCRYANRPASFEMNQVLEFEPDSRLFGPSDWWLPLQNGLMILSAGSWGGFVDRLLHVHGPCWQFQKFLVLVEQVT